jgi:hypothetical protein
MQKNPLFNVGKIEWNKKPDYPTRSKKRFDPDPSPCYAGEGCWHLSFCEKTAAHCRRFDHWVFTERLDESFPIIDYSYEVSR